MIEQICDCCGDSGLHASTHIKQADRLCCDLCGHPIYPRWRFRFSYNWHAWWVGAHWYRTDRVLIAQPLPCLGFLLNFGDNP
jgi:hypothetical protein